MLFGQSFAKLLEDKASRALEIVAEDGVDDTLPLGPNADVNDTRGRVQAAIAESVLRSLRKAWQLLLMPEGMRGLLDEDDAPETCWTRILRKLEKVDENEANKPKTQLRQSW
jgi:hypothetical protein